MDLQGEVCANHDQGYITSPTYSPVLQSHIGIGFLKNGFNRYGDVIRAVTPPENRTVMVEVVSPHFVDPEGDRLRV